MSLQEAPRNQPAIQLPCSARVYEDSDGTYYAQCPDGWVSENFAFKAAAIDEGKRHESVMRP